MMKALLGCLLLLAFVTTAMAQDAASPAAPQMDMTKVGPASRTVAKAKETNKEIGAFLKQCEEAMKKHDLETSAALVDFPVLMATDDSKGEAGGDAMNKDQWTAMMKPWFDQPMPKEMKMVTKPTISLMTDSLAMVVMDYTMTMGKVKKTWKTTELLVKKGGKWLIKMEAEGGWGDMMKPPTAAQ